jgi:hypothetical protein
MDATISPSDAAITTICAHPRCGAATTLAESTYIDGCGQVCPACAGLLPEGWDESFEPPF